MYLGDVVVYFDRSTQPGNDTTLTHSGVVVSNRDGDVVMISKFDRSGGLYMHRPEDLQAYYGSPSIYTTDHPAGRFMVPKTEVNWMDKA